MEIDHICETRFAFFRNLILMFLATFSVMGILAWMHVVGIW